MAIIWIKKIINNFIYIFRLTYLVTNNNFVVYNAEDDIDVIPNFEVPSDKDFKDVNSSKVLPNLTRQHVELFCKT